MTREEHLRRISRLSPFCNSLIPVALNTQVHETDRTALGPALQSPDFPPLRISYVDLSAAHK